MSNIRVVKQPKLGEGFIWFYFGTSEIWKKQTHTRKTFGERCSGWKTTDNVGKPPRNNRNSRNSFKNIGKRKSSGTGKHK